jgi:MFS family permease
MIPNKNDAVSPARTLTVLGLGTALSLLGDSTLYTVLPDPTNAATAGVTLTAVGFILGANRLTRIFTNPLAGSLLGRFPRRFVLVPAMLIGFLCTLIYALGSGITVFLLGRVLWGFAWSGIWIGGNSVVLDISQAESRGRFSGRYQTWFFVGVGGSALLGGVFTDALGFRGGLFVSATLNAVALLLWFFLLPETGPPTDGFVDEASVNKALDWPTIWHAALPIFGMRFVYAGVIASSSILWLTSLFQSSFYLTNITLPIATVTGAFVAMRTITSMLSGPISGEISDRLGRRWGVIAGLLFLGSLGTWLMGYSDAAVAIFGGFVAAIPGGGVQALIPALIGDRIDPEQESRVLGVVYTFGDLGSALGPVIGLGLIEKIGLPSIYRFCSLLLIVLAIISTLRLRFEPNRLTSSNS